MKTSRVIALALLCVAGRTMDASADCRIETSPLVFPPYDVYAAAPVDAVASIRFSCVRERGAASLRIHLEQASDGIPDRHMRSGGETLRYDVFVDPARHLAWGDGTAGTRAQVRRCCDSSAFETVNVYGLIFQGQDVAGGTYEDSLTVAIEF